MDRIENNNNRRIDEEWITVTKRRLAELRSGKVKPIPGQVVFSQIKARFSEFQSRVNADAGNANP